MKFNTIEARDRIKEFISLVDDSLAKQALEHCCKTLSKVAETEFARANDSRGGRIAITEPVGDYNWDTCVRIVCGGKVNDLGYRCCKQIGHKGKCWSKEKSVDFWPDVYGEET